MTRDDITNDYFDWLYNLVCKNRYSDNISYRKLLSYLHDTEFRWSIRRDQNRAMDGIDLRFRFAHEYIVVENADAYLSGPCSVLEMMIALAIRCEETIMDNPNIGNRTGQWFWGMIVSLGLGSMYDSRFDEYYVRLSIEKFLDRRYDPNGRGGLFTIRHCDRDLTKVEIWYQLCWYLDSIT